MFNELPWTVEALRFLHLPGSRQAVKEDNNRKDNYEAGTYQHTPLKPMSSIKA